MQRLEKAVEAKGRLLQVDRQGGVSGGIARGFVLTFDVGRLLVEVAAGKVHSVVLESADEVPAGVENVSQDEPWWRTIGCPLTRVWAGEVGAQGLRLQFREDDKNPKVIAFIPDGSEVRVSLES